MTKDIWHYARTQLAEQVIGMFEAGLSSALVFFAPRRMGKTEFLRKDVSPAAVNMGWKVFYFSFLDAGGDIEAELVRALTQFSEMTLKSNKRKFAARIQKVTGSVAGVKASVEFNNNQTRLLDIKNIIALLSEQGKVLLLMDEVQALARDKNNERFIAGLRTALDMDKDKIKVIFTGSSREDLRLMFSEATAPFFHFGQNLPFPEFDRAFTDYLADTFKVVTNRKIDKNDLWDAFLRMDKVPQLARSLVERLVLNPGQSLNDLTSQLLKDVFNDRDFVETWKKLTALEKLILKMIAKDARNMFAEKSRSTMAQRLGVESLEVSTVQSAVRSLRKKRIIGKLNERAGYFIDDPNFKTWLLTLNQQ